MNQYVGDVDNDTNNQVDSALSPIMSYLQSLQTYSNEDFVAQKVNLMQQIYLQFNQVKRYFPSYAVAAMERNGLLANTDVSKTWSEAVESLTKRTNEAIKAIETEAQGIISQANQKAKEIEASVRKTAQKISVSEAQEQFTKAIQEDNKQINFWGGVTITLVLVFVVFLCYLFNVELPEQWTWQVIYHSVIRIAVLSLISAILGFSFKMLKAHLHMKQHNLHRQRIANSIASFVESASSQDQRDSILSLMVSSVVSFGNSGIVDGSEDSTSKISIDNITKTIGGLKE